MERILLALNCVGSRKPPHRISRAELTSVTESQIDAFLAEAATIIDAPPPLPTCPPVAAGHKGNGQVSSPMPIPPRALSVEQRSHVENIAKRSLENIANAPRGTSNDTINQEAYTLAGLVAAGLPAEGLREYALEVALERAAKGGNDRRETQATFESGWANGLKSPWVPGAGMPAEAVAMARASVERLLERQAQAASNRAAGVAHASNDAWPVPKPIESSLPAVERFIPELLPLALRDYVLDVADRQQAPPDFAAVAALCGLASLAGNAVRVRPKQHDDWEVVPNLWGAIIGRPSAMKSPAMRSALAPVYALQDTLRKEWETAKREAKIEAALSELDAKEASKKAAKAFQDGDREGAKRLLAEQARNDEEEAPCPRLIVNDATVEKLGELLNENPRGLLLIRDELPGFLARMESEEHQSERAFYLEAFNGDGQFTYDRIGRGTVRIENCTLSIIGGVQPARIAPLVKGAMTGVSDDGLIQRLQLAVWPDDIGSWVWTDRSPDAPARKQYEGAFRDLHTFSRSLDSPAVFGFSSEAQELFREWMTEVQTEARAGKLPSILESHLLKMPKTVASLALLFHLVDGERGAIGVNATRRALGWAEYLRSHANRLYSAGGVMAETGRASLSSGARNCPKPSRQETCSARHGQGLPKETQLRRRSSFLSAPDIAAKRHLLLRRQAAGLHWPMSGARASRWRADRGPMACFSSRRRKKRGNGVRSNRQNRQNPGGDGFVSFVSALLWRF